MRVARRAALAVLVGLVGLAEVAASAQSQPAPRPTAVPVLVGWRGVVTPAQAGDAPDVRAVTDAAAWGRLWAEWRPGEPPPEVNFDQALVLASVNGDRNRFDVHPQLHADGTLKVVMQTQLLGFMGQANRAYVLAVVRRDGVKSVHPTYVQPDTGRRRAPVAVVK